jgi:hypothetical protein
MNVCPLTTLHDHFSRALQEQSYIGPSDSDPKKLESLPTKKIRLHEVFKIALQQIQDDLKKSAGQIEELKINSLKQLQEDGKKYYERYTNSTNTWSRWVLKGLAHYTPTCLNIILPSCFFNGMKAAEEATKNAYNAYKLFLEQTLNPGLQNLPVGEGEIFDKIIEEEEVQGAPIFDARLPKTIVVAVSKEELEKKRQQDIACHLNAIRESTQYLNQFNQSPFTLEKYKKVMIEIVAAIRALSELDPENAQKSVEALGLSANTFKVLANDEFNQALNSNEEKKLMELLESTDWEASFAEAVAQKGYLKFNLRAIPGNQEKIVEFRDDQQKNIQQAEVKNYRGTIILGLTKLEGAATSDEQALHLLQNFVQFLQINKNCRPNKIEIQLEGRSLNLELFKHLLTLSEIVSEIELKDLEVINFTEVSCSAEEEKLFIERLNHFTCSDLKEVILLDGAKSEWTVQNFSQLLAACPQMNLLKKFYQLCSSPQEIVIPPQLRRATTLDLSEYPLDSISHLLKQFPLLTHLNLNGLQMSDDQLNGWIKQGYFNSITSLKLENCNLLTTDSLYYLTNLPNLTRLSLPDLPKGNLGLDELPKFQNPFKVKLFYIASKATQDIATSYYTGPSAWAAVFQIPLARAGVAKIFDSQMTILDPKSVAYWLYEDDYKKLTPQESITTIVADTNVALTDENIVELLQKFPKTTTLSLYHCPTITNQGIIKLLNAFPTLKNIDLTGCSQITNDLFLSNLDFTTFDLETLNITDTGISKENAEDIKRRLGSKIVFEETVLKITNDQLRNPENIENILQNYTLNHLRRIDLTGCENLTDEMLGQLLDYLNNPMWIERMQKDGIWEDNPMRLNLAVLNLTGCIKIKNDAFQTYFEGGRTEFKQLETLDRIITSGTQISQDLEKVYPQVTFQKQDKPDSLQINPRAQLQACQTYNEKTQLAMQGNEEANKELKKLSQTMIHNRIVVELFSSSDENQEFVKLVLSQPIDPNAEEFCNFTLSFKTGEHEDDSTIVHTHRDVLLSQSPFFIKSFRPGEALSKIPGLDFEFNKNALELTNKLTGLFFGQIRIENLDHKTAAAIAEPVGSSNFNLLKSFYQKVLSQIHSQFDLSTAQDLMLAAVELNDIEGMKKYDDFLLSKILNNSQDDHFDCQPFTDLVNIYPLNLPHLKARVEQIHEYQSAQITQLLMQIDLASW